MQGVREIANLVFWVDNTRHLLMDDAMQNRRALPREKQVILQQLVKDNVIVIKPSNSSSDNTHSHQQHTDSTS